MCDFQFLLTLQTLVFYGLFFVFGLGMRLFPPKPNKLFGFRTHRATKNENDWYHAQRFASKWMMIFASIFCTVSIVIKYLTGFLYPAFILYTIIDTLFLIVATFMIYFFTEDRLRKKNRP